MFSSFLSRMMSCFLLVCNVERTVYLLVPLLALVLLFTAVNTNKQINNHKRGLDELRDIISETFTYT